MEKLENANRTKISLKVWVLIIGALHVFVEKYEKNIIWIPHLIWSHELNSGFQLNCNAILKKRIYFFFVYFYFYFLIKHRKNGLFTRCRKESK